MSKEDKNVNVEVAGGETTTKVKLFSNSKSISDEAFGISRVFPDKLNQIISELNQENASESFKNSKTTFKTKNNSTALRITGTNEQIETAEQFYKALEKIKSGKVLQTLFALWSYSSDVGSFVFRDVKLTKIMGKVLNSKDGTFNQPQRKEFTEAIQKLRDFEIFLDQTITEKDERGRKKQFVKRDFHRIIEISSAVYSKRKNDVVDEDTGDIIFRKGEADDSVILKLNGELLPNLNKGIMRGRLYSKGLLKLDANKDEKAILLGFKLSTRFDQLRQGARGQDLVNEDNLFIKTTRKNLIEWAGYNKTDNWDKWSANRHLKNTLDKLIEAKLIKSYKEKDFSTNDNEIITILPYPVSIKLV